jgi:hypothetical protein
VFTRLLWAWAFRNPHGGYRYLMSTDDADDTLPPMEATDSDELHNADGDEVVDPPEDWSGVEKHGMTAEEEREGAPLEERLAAEVPDVTPGDVDPRDADRPESHPVRHRGQVDGAPEDGDSLFPVIED